MKYHHHIDAKLIALEARLVNTRAYLHYLEDIELQIIRLRHVPEDGVVGGLLTGLDLAQLHPRVQGGGAEHLHKQL